MYGRILIPLDGSKTAEKVLPYARLLTRTLRVPAELMVVVDVATMATHLSGAKARDLDMLIAQEERISKVYLENMIQSFPGGGVKYSIEKGRPEEVIIEKATAEKNTLIAMATHGRSGLDRWLLGSVAEKVLRGTENPLLLVRADEAAGTDGEAMLKTVIVPLDGSQLAEAVLPRAIEAARTLKLEVILLRAYELPAAAYYGSEAYLPNYDELKAQFKLKVTHYLDAKIKAIKSQGVDRVSCLVLEGSGPDEIIGCARNNPGSLVAMCTHGRSGVKRWILGSVTEKVVRHSGDPVLIVRAA